MHAYNLCGGSMNWYKMFFVQTLPNMGSVACKTTNALLKSLVELKDNSNLCLWLYLLNRSPKRTWGNWCWEQRSPTLSGCGSIGRQTPQASPLPSHPTLFEHPPWILNRKQAVADPCSIGKSHFEGRTLSLSFDSGREAGLRWSKPVN